MKELHTGNKCPDCKNGKIALMVNFVTHAEKDPEPYESGIEEGEQEEVYLDDSITVSIHACDECGKLVSACLDTDLKEIKVDEEIDNFIEKLRKSQAEKNQPDDKEWNKKNFAILILRQLKKRLGL